MHNGKKARRIRRRHKILKKTIPVLLTKENTSTVGGSTASVRPPAQSVKTHKGGVSLRGRDAEQWRFSSHGRLEKPSNILNKATRGKKTKKNEDTVKKRNFMKKKLSR